ncbi:DNA polymerase [Bacillus phage BSTP3]|nr:DNA polymerase [Bacillus phage BSTP3]
MGQSAAKPRLRNVQRLAERRRLQAIGSRNGRHPSG